MTIARLPGRYVRLFSMLGSLTACAASGGGGDEPEDFDLLADQAPFGQVSIEAHAQPPEGGSASVSVAALGAIACTGSVCFSNLFSSPTFSATANPGFHFVQWTGCSAAGTNATTTLGPVAQDERCTAVFEADVVPPPEPVPQPAPEPAAPPPAPAPAEPAAPSPPAAPVPYSDFPTSMTPQERLFAKYDSFSPEMKAGFGALLSGVVDCDSIPDHPYACHYIEFEFGRIYTLPTGRTTEIHGAIYGAWLAHPRHNPTNSYPSTDEMPTVDGRGRTSAANEYFYWTLETGAHGVHWWTHQWWTDSGHGAGPWGYPKGDYFLDYDSTRCPAAPTNSLIAQEFEAGWVCSDWDRGWLVPNPKP